MRNECERAKRDTHARARAHARAHTDRGFQEHDSGGARPCVRVAPQLRRVELIDEQWAELRKQTLHRRAARATVQPEDQRRARRVHLLRLDQPVVQEAPRRRAGIRRHVDVARVMARRQRPAPARQRAHLVPYRRASRQRSELRHSQRPERRSRRRSHHSSPGAQPCRAAVGASPSLCRSPYPIPAGAGAIHTNTSLLSPRDYPVNFFRLAVAEALFWERRWSPIGSATQAGGADRAALDLIARRDGAGSGAGGGRRWRGWGQAHSIG